MNTLFDPQTESEKPTPFVLEHRLAYPQSNGDFTPSSVLWLTPCLRSSGLLQLLPGEELKTLLLVFTFLTPEGGFVATPELLASALETSKSKAASAWNAAPPVSNGRTN